MSAEDPYAAAADAAHAVYSNAEHELLRAALDAYRGVLSAAGLLRGDTLPANPAAVELAARFLASQATAAGFPRYAGDGWKKLVESATDVTVAFTKASAGIGRDEVLDRELAEARRLLRVHHAQDQQAGDRP